MLETLGIVACGFIYVISVLIVSSLDHEYCGNCVDSAFIEYTSVLSISIIWNGNVIVGVLFESLHLKPRSSEPNQ